MKVSIVVPCKGRLGNLKNVIPAMLSQETTADYDIMVVDYGCPDGTFTWCKEQNNPKLHSIRVLDNVEKFNLSRCRNLGAKHSNGELLAFVDGDIVIPPTFVQVGVQTIEAFDCDSVAHAVVYDSARHVRVMVNGESVAGYTITFILPKFNWENRKWTVGCELSSCIFVKRSFWERCRGYDEAFQGWGYDDVDFVNRLRKIEDFRQMYALQQINFVHTDPSLPDYFELDRNVSREENRKRMHSDRIVNPSGFGMTEKYEIF